MCGIFAYLSYLTPTELDSVLETLLNGLKRLEYRGYDSAGLAVDLNDFTHILRSVGKVSNLEKVVAEFKKAKSTASLEKHVTTVAISHTRWATHGAPCEKNAHPHSSNDANEFSVVHNGILSNYKDLKAFLLNNGYQFESDTDTEVIPKLLYHIYRNWEDKSTLSFLNIVEQAVSQLEGSFALAIKSSHFPGEIVGARRGSPLLVGIKASDSVTINHIPVSYSNQKSTRYRNDSFKIVKHSEELNLEAGSRGIEYFLSSDARLVTDLLFEFH
ncbi:Glutamine--fructose-6-phosphate aminotransferase [isomerizing] 2 [Cichlidogyrus casuarinus]|uniref:glutamine--fructose-6-phosphate transaminase (isomerizing) n=1 Tax=Cichlidogyrus casuarinus TaxID=1844966 RepID=A0ABD2QHP3_9PLAT